MAHHNRRYAAARGAVEAVNVAAADAARGNADEHFTGCRDRRGRLGDFQVVICG
jgi:hypothetical protein